MTVRRLAAGLGALGIALVSVVVVAPPAPAAEGTIQLGGHAPWVGRGGEFALRLAVDTAEPDDAEVAVTLYPAVGSRSEFNRTLDARPRGAPINVVSTPLRELATPEADHIEVPIRLQDPSLPRDPERVLLRGSGVYPVSVELRSVGGGPSVDRFTTYLVHVADAVAGPRLGVSLVIPVAAPPAFRRDGTHRLDSARESEIAAVAESLLMNPQLELTVVPNPETLGAIQSPATLDALQQALAGRQVLAAPFTRMLLPAYRRLPREASLQESRGRAVVRERLGRSPDRDTVLVDNGIDQTSLSRIERRGVHRVVVPEYHLEPLALPLTLAQPYLLATAPAPSRREAPPTILAASADEGLAAHFGGSDPVLAAHHLLADLAVLYFDSPGRTRGVVAAPDAGWRPRSEFLGVVLDGLGRSPFLDPMTLDRFFDGVDLLADGPRATPMVRQLAPAENQAALPEEAIRALRRQIDALHSMAGDANGVAQRYGDRLLAAQSGYYTRRQQVVAVADLQRDLQAEIATIRVPTNRSITLTAHSGEIPITVFRGVDYPVKVMIRLHSDKLHFPEGGSAVLDLTRENTTRRFTVHTRTSGTFPVQVSVTSPDGLLELGTGRLTIRSRAVSGVGIGVTATASLFLVVWWGRHLRRPA